jgi:hypothetical protein
MIETSERFQLKPGSYEKVRRQHALRSIVILLLISIPMGWVMFRDDPNVAEDRLFLKIGIWALLIGYLFFRILRKDPQANALFYSYQLTIHPYSITRSSGNSTTVSIPLNQVESIQRLYNGSYKITSANATDVIYIPNYIQNMERVEELLQSIQPLAASSPLKGFQRLLPYLVLFPVGLFFGMLATRDKIVVGITAPLFIVAMVLALIYSQRSKIEALRKGRWFYIMMIAVTVWYILQVFSGKI